MVTAAGAVDAERTSVVTAAAAVDAERTSREADTQTQPAVSLSLTHKRLYKMTTMLIHRIYMSNTCLYAVLYSSHLVYQIVMGKS